MQLIEGHHLIIFSVIEKYILGFAIGTGIDPIATAMLL